MPSLRSNLTLSSRLLKVVAGHNEERNQEARAPSQRRQVRQRVHKAKQDAFRLRAFATPFAPPKIPRMQRAVSGHLNRPRTLASTGAMSNDCMITHLSTIPGEQQPTRKPKTSDKTGRIRQSMARVYHEGQGGGKENDEKGWYRALDRRMFG